MLKPRKHNDQKSLLDADMLTEFSELSRMAPTFGREAPEGYVERAKAYNAKCKELGATLMMVAEG